MSADFETVLVKDDRLAVSSSIRYAVVKGGQNMTVAKFDAVSKSPSQLTFNVQVPSETTIIDRRVMLRMDFDLTLTGTVGAGQYLVNYGTADALAPFPCHQLFSTLQATINNNTVNINCQDVINALIRSNDIRELQAYNSLTPVAFDTYFNYADAVLANNNPNGSYVIQSDNDLAPRGAYYIDPASITGNTIGTGAGQARTVVLKVSVVEPLLISPFIFADPKSNNQGFYGIQNLNLVANLAANAHRAFRSANAFITGATVSAVDKAELIFNFLTGHPSDMLPARNVVPE